MCIEFQTGKQSPISIYTTTGNPYMRLKVQCFSAHGMPYFSVNAFQSAPSISMFTGGFVRLVQRNASNTVVEFIFEIFALQDLKRLHYAILLSVEMLCCITHPFGENCLYLEQCQLFMVIYYASIKNCECSQPLHVVKDDILIFLGMNGLMCVSFICFSVWLCTIACTVYLYVILHLHCHYA